MSQYIWQYIDKTKIGVISFAFSNLSSFSGHYMYVESSDGAMFDHAVLQSMVYPEIPKQYQPNENSSNGKCKVCITGLRHVIFVQVRI